MAFGFAPGDIIKGLNVCHELCKTWLDPVQRAEEQYLEFLREVRMFEGTLKDLKCVLVGPTALPGKTRRTSEILNPQAREHAIQSIDKERRDIIGDFENTLYQCRILLDENAKYSRGQKANFFTNAVWHYGGNQEKATSLRTRLQFHAVKIGLVMQPLNAGLLQQIDGKVDKTLKILTERELPPVPENLEQLYLEAVETNAPPGYFNLDNIPLREAFDALLMHYGESTTGFRGNELNIRGGAWSPTAKQFNNLIKSRWLFDRLRSSDTLKNAGPLSLWVGVLTSFKEKIESEYRRFDAELPASYADMLKLSLDHFSIWPPSEEVDTVQLMLNPDPAKDEVKVLENIPLVEPRGYDQSELILFRARENEVRIVRLDRRESDRPIPTPTYHNLHSSALIPHYALEASMGLKQIEIRPAGVRNGHEFELKDNSDMQKLQRALLGFEVLSDISDVAWTYHASSGMRTKKKSGIGRIQIWLSEEPEDILAGSTSTLTIQNVATLASPDPRRTSTISARSPTSLSRIDSGTTPSVRSVGGSSQGRRTVVGSQRQPLPVLVIITTLGSQPVFFQLSLTRLMRSKDIVANESGSLRVMVECNPPKRDKFTMKMHMPTTKEDTPPALTSLNLALLGLSHDDTLDSRRHPNYEDLEMIENIRWITFDFQDTADLEKFHESFKKADDERSRRDDEFAAVSSAMKAQAAKPRNGSIRTHSEVGSVLSFRSGSVSSFQSGSDRRASGYDSRR